MVSENDLWESEDIDSEQGEYVFVRQEDIVEGIACFMAAYLLSLKQTKVCYISSKFDAFSDPVFTMQVNLRFNYFFKYPTLFGF